MSLLDKVRKNAVVKKAIEKAKDPAFQKQVKDKAQDYADKRRRQQQHHDD